MRKLLLILVLSGVLLVVSGGIVLAASNSCVSCCCTDDDCAIIVANIASLDKLTAPAQGYEYKCSVNVALTNVCECKVESGQWVCQGGQIGSCSQQKKVVGTGGTTPVVTGGPAGGPAECIEVKHKIIIDLVKEDGSGVQEVVFEKGAVVAGSAIGSNVCPAAPDGIAEGSTCVSLGPIEKDERCWAKEFGIIVLLNTIYTVTDWMFYILTLIVVLMVIYGGFVILTASGSPEKAGKGKGILTYAIIGLAVALLAKIIPSLVKFIMGV